MLGKTERAGTRRCLQLGYGKFPTIKLIVIALLSSITMASASHFVVPYTKTGSYMTVLADTSIHPTINGVALQDSDEVGVFDSTGLCVGAAVWTGTGNLGITVWGQTSAGNGTTDSGMLPGQTLLYHLWSKSANLEVLAAATYTSGTGADPNNTYVANGILYLAGLNGYSLPAVPNLSSPSNNATGQSITAGLTWGTAASATSYGVEISASAGFGSTVFLQSGLTAPSTTASGLANGTAYYWRANGANPIGTSAWSTAWTFTTAQGKPAVPALSAPTNGSVNQPITLSLQWGAAAGASTYAIQVSTDVNFGSTVQAQSGLASPGATASGLAYNTTYFWRADASNPDSTSNWSSVWSFTTTIAAPGIPALASPTSGTVNASITPNLSWGTVAGAASYSLMVSTSSSFSTTVSSQTGLTVASVSLSGLANSTTYYWEVNAANVGGTSAWSGAWSFTTIIAAPAVPTLATPTSGTVNEPTSPTLTWGTVTGAASYTLMVSTAASFATTVSSQTGLTVASGSVIGLANSTLYYWEVKSTNAGGTSNWSSVWSFTTIIGAPVAPALATPTSGSVNVLTSPTLTWGTVANAASYSLMVSTAANFATTVSSQTGLTGVSASLSGLANSSTYYWEVNAANIGGTSGWSGAWSFTTIIAAPVAPTLSAPTSGAVNQPISLSLSWGTVTGAASYSLMVSTAANFATTVSSQSGLTVASASLIGLANSTQYYWEVKSTNIGGTSNWSSVWNFTTIIAAPVAPVLATPTSGSVNVLTSPTLTWGTVANAASYSLMVSTAANFATTVSSQTGLTGVSASLSGLANSSTYYWEVNAANIGGTSGWSGAWSFTTIIAAPVSPTLVTPTSGSVNVLTSPTLTWGTVANAASYSLMVSTAANFATTVSSQTGLTGVSASLSGLANSSTYYWEVNAANVGGISAWSGAWSFTTIIAAPGVPVLATPTSGTSNASTTPTLTWGTVTGAASYSLMVSTAANFATTVSSQAGLTVASASLSNLANSTQYYWEVNATNAGGISAWSGAWNFTTIIAAPVAPTLATPTSGTANASTSPTLTWGTVTGAASYSLMISTAANFATTVSSQSGLTGVSVSLSSLANSTQYYWEVKATNVGGTSNWSSVWSFTTIIATPVAPVLATPTSGTVNTSVSPTLTWGSVTGAASYSLMVSTAANFATTVSSQTGLTAASASLSNLANSTQYYWEVNATNVGGISAWSGAWSFTTIIAAPVAPALATPTSGTSNASTSPTLTWGTVASAASYSLMVSTAANFATTVSSQTGLTAASASLSNLANSTQYYWEVNATNVGGISAWSGAWSFTTIIAAPGVPVLATPTSGTANASTSPTLTWGTVASAASYSLMVSTAANFATTVSSQTGLTAASASLSNLANSTQYYWEVNASNVGGISAWSGAWSFTTVIAAPGVPVLATPTSGALNQPISLSLTWGAVTGAASYSLMVSTSAGFASTVSSLSGLTGTSASLSGLANSTLYYWEVKSTNVGGTSNWSSVWSFTTIIAAPVAPALATPTSGTVNASVSPTLTWGAVSGAASYSLMVSTSASFATTVSSQIGLTGVSASLTGLANSTQYYWEVNATNVGGTSAWSGAWSFTTIIAAPAAPALSSPGNGTANEPVSALGLIWGTSALASSYEVEISTSSSFGNTVFDQTGSGTAATVNGLANSTTYYWRANASNAGGLTWSAAWSFTTIIAIPPAPVLVTPTSGAINEPIASLGLSWSTAAGASLYEVEVSTSNAFGSTLFDQVGASQSATVNGLAYSTTYYWRADASNLAGTGSWATANSFTTVPPAPGTPVLAAPASGSLNVATSLTMSWGTVAGAASYAVLVSTASNFASTVSSQPGLTGASASLAGLANSTVYYWEVNAANAGGASAWSGAWSFTTIIAAPVAPVLASPSSGAINEPTSLTMVWGTVTGAASYTVLVSTTSNFASTVSSQPGLTGASASLAGLANSTVYYWEVNAANAGGTSAWSGAWNFTTIIATPVAPTLATPSNGTVNEPTTVTMNWGAVTGAASYSVLVSTAANFAATVSSQTGLTGVSASLSGLANSATYYWEVNAANIGGTSAWSGVWSFTTIIPAPAAPVLAAPTNGAVGQPVASLSLSWGSSAGAALYEVAVSLSSAFGSTIFDQTGATLTTATVSGLANGTTYYWRANASNAGGTSWAAAWSFTTAVLRQIPVATAWNTVSLNVIPSGNDSSATVFGTGPAGDFLFIKDNAGDVYCPALGQDDIHYFQIGQGYQVYSSLADTFHIAGAPVNPATTAIPLTAGWNLISYLPSVPDSIVHALASIDSQLVIVKNNAGQVYWPAYNIDNIDSMLPGQGYKMLMSSAASLTYPTPLAGVAKRSVLAGNGPVYLHLPNPVHYASHVNTGNNATLLAKNVSFGDRTAPDSSEIGAYDASGNLVGAGTVLHGRAAFAIWGIDPVTRKTNACSSGDKLSFKLWDGSREYPLDFVSSNGAASKYSTDGVYLGTLAVASGYFIKQFDLTRAYPNPFRSVVKISFDIPAISGMNNQNVELNVYDMRGSLVHQIAKGQYAPGHYTVEWSAAENRSGGVGSNIYIVRMKAKNFDKRIKLVRVE